MPNRIKRWLFRRALRRRSILNFPEQICQRKSDGSLWQAGHAADIGLCNATFFRKDKIGFWHFYRLREWRGELIASPKIFWLPRSGEWDLLPSRRKTYTLPRFEIPIETAKILAEIERQERCRD